MRLDKITYFEYTRKSLKDDDRQVVSLESQEYDLSVVAKREKAHVKELFRESRTAKFPGRPEFNRLLDQIERGEGNGILVWDIDRLYRNPVDEGRVRWLLQQGIIASILTPTRQYFPQDAGLLMAIEGGRAIEHNLRFAKALKRTHESKLRNGQWPGTRVLGYLFEQRVKNIVPDPETAPTMTRLFEEFAKGTLGLEAGARWLASQGIASGNGTPFAKSKMVRILKNKIYMGLIPWNSEIHQGRFKPLVPVEIFTKVQQVMKIKSKPRKYRNGHNFPFCGIFTCSCGSMITAQWAKGHGGTYRYYRCTKKAGRCAEPYIQEQYLTEQCLELLRPLALSPLEVGEIRAEIKLEEAKDAGTLGDSSRKVGEALANLMKNSTSSRDTSSMKSSMRTCIEHQKRRF
jgi:site-specific DNA recombinase